MTLPTASPADMARIGKGERWPPETLANTSSEPVSVSAKSEHVAPERDVADQRLAERVRRGHQ